MRLLSVIRLRLRSLLQPASVEQELDDELRYHIERQIDANLAAGLSTEEARAAARRSAAGIRATERGVSRHAGTESARQPAAGWPLRAPSAAESAHLHRRGSRHAGARPGRQRRHLRLRGRGAHQAAAVSAGRLASSASTKRVTLFPRSNLSYPDYLDWKKLNTVFTSLSAYQGGGVLLTTPAGAERAPGARVSDDFFRTLGCRPDPRSRFPPRRGSARRAAHGHPQLRRVAEAVRRRADVLGRTVTAERRPERHRRRPAAGVSFCSRGLAGVLDDAARRRVVRFAAWRATTCMAWRAWPTASSVEIGRCQREGDRQPAGDSVPGLESRPGRDGGRASPK